MTDTKPRITIEFCVPWDYLDRAVSLAEELMDRWAPVLDGVELKTGSKGRFEVLIDGQEVFSKARLNRFPADGEVAKLLQPRLGPPPKWRSEHK